MQQKHLGHCVIIEVWRPHAQTCWIRFVRANALDVVFSRTHHTLSRWFTKMADMETILPGFLASGPDMNHSAPSIFFEKFQRRE